jgi:2-oxoglutarate dehydrogenase E2 component (dihydrolipoamide succinyltransferase)
VSETVTPWRERAVRETRRFLSPVVRRLASELRLDPTTLVGHGRDGRVTRADVLAAAGRDEVVPFNNIRKRTAVALASSKREAAHALVSVAVDYSAIEAVRRDAHLTTLPFVARAVIDALREFPACNATIAGDGDAVALHRAVHLGIAVDLEFQGLVVPVVHDADGLRLPALAGAIRETARRARARQLTPDDLAGGTFTITNPGASGTWISFPVINRPQVAILATDGVSKQVVADDEGDDSEATGGERSAESTHRYGRLRIAPIGHLSLSFDHRALDGAYAGAFLRRVKAIVEARDWNVEL